MILSGKNEENTSMEKAKQCLIAVLLGVFLTTTVLSGCGQSKKYPKKIIILPCIYGKIV